MGNEVFPFCSSLVQECWRSNPALLCTGRACAVLGVVSIALCEQDQVLHQVSGAVTSRVFWGTLS